MKSFEVAVARIDIRSDGKRFSIPSFAKANEVLLSLISSSERFSQRADFEFLYQDSRVIFVPSVEIVNEASPTVEEILSHHFGELFADRNLLYPYLDDAERDAIVYSRVFETRKLPEDILSDSLSEYSVACGSYEGVPDVALLPELSLVIKDRADIWSEMEVFPHNLNMHSIFEISIEEFDSLLQKHLHEYVPRVNYIAHDDDGKWYMGDNRDNLFAVVSDFPDRSSAIEFANFVFTLDEEQAYYESRAREGMLSKHSTKPKQNNACEFYCSHYAKTLKSIGNMVKADAVLIGAMREVRMPDDDIAQAMRNFSPQCVNNRPNYVDRVYQLSDSDEVRHAALKLAKIASKGASPQR